MMDMLRSHAFWAGFWKGYARIADVLLPPAAVVVFCALMGWL